MNSSVLISFFFFNDTATTEIYTLSLHDALPIRRSQRSHQSHRGHQSRPPAPADRKRTRLNSSHDQTSYAVFCLKKKKTKDIDEALTDPEEKVEHGHTSNQLP